MARGIGELRIVGKKGTYAMQGNNSNVPLLRLTDLPRMGHLLLMGHRPPIDRVLLELCKPMTLSLFMTVFDFTPQKLLERSYKICQALYKEDKKVFGLRKKDNPFALQSNVLKRSASESLGVGAVQAS
ncbi:hypothetical protein KSC_102990 [Ktedonobacter sp. SOSP1-52]|uniref:hypothetical protein n=1 Tax=Ktedonobacter sp. SOSP1-52 TaxID=2778366 RepID=UPI00191687CD|nr:hypothetical protein [Ktedonobacter sp. SOSP1-52]GHO71407.1 hypothetical protein KSC_102990 [Ktedonobacter sp. SOSP1-52]